MRRKEWRVLATTAPPVEFLLYRFNALTLPERREKFSDMLIILNDDMNAAFEVQEWKEEQSK